MFGEVADALLLSSQRIEPAKLKETGYEFRHPELESAFQHMLGRISELRCRYHAGKMSHGSGKQHEVACLR